MEERRTKNPGRAGAPAGDPPAGESAPRPSRERGSFGAWLRTQREARGVSVQAIAEASKISVRYLEALEGDRFDVLPAPVFVRGFLREYARVVGLDGDEVVNFYLLSQPAKPAERSTEGRVAAARGEREAARRAPLVGYVVLVVASLAVFVGIAAAISWWAGRRAAPTATPPARAASASAPASTAASTAPPTAAVEPPAATAIVADAATPAAPYVTTPPAPVAATPQAPAAVATGRLRVVLEFQQDCWVEVVLDGRRRESELKAGGETLALEADEYVSLTLGNAPAVRVEVNGRPFPLSTRESRVVRDLRIDRSTLAPQAPAADESPGR
jgi:cytoskeleton protein RodZ